MSMNGSFRQISARLHDRLRREPELMPRALDEAREIPAEVIARFPESMQVVIREQKARFEALPAIDPSDLGRFLHIDKAWHAVHFLIAGSAEATPGAGAFVLGGADCGSDLGYGPARLLAPDVVEAIARELPPADSLRARFDPQALARAAIYPNHWDEPADELWDWIGGAYESVRELYGESSGRAIIAFLH